MGREAISPTSVAQLLDGAGLREGGVVDVVVEVEVGVLDPHGCDRLKGTQASLRRNGASRCMRASSRCFIRARSKGSGEVDGSRTMVATTCECIDGVSR